MFVPNLEIMKEERLFRQRAIHEYNTVNLIAYAEIVSQLRKNNPEDNVRWLKQHEIYQNIKPACDESDMLSLWTMFTVFPDGFTITK